jgi:hypothetical protein
VVSCLGCPALYVIVLPLSAYYPDLALAPCLPVMVIGYPVSAVLVVIFWLFYALPIVLFISCPRCPSLAVYL